MAQRSGMNSNFTSQKRNLWYTYETRDPNLDDLVTVTSYFTHLNFCRFDELTRI